MAQRIVIPHVSRIEGHAKIAIQLNDAGEVDSAQLHVTQVRGFERFTEGRPYYEMPSITARICGICPVSHLLASSKACDAIMAVRIPPAAKLLRELLHCAQFVQSHALSFFHLSAPDLLLGMDSDPAQRNILGVLEQHPELARDGIALRKFGQMAIERLAGERIHPAWVVPGGVHAALKQESRDAILGELPIARSIVRRTLQMFKGVLDGFAAEIDSFDNEPTAYAGLVTRDGSMNWYDGTVSFVDEKGAPLASFDDPIEYSDYIGEAAVPFSYLKAPYFIPRGLPGGDLPRRPVGAAERGREVRNAAGRRGTGGVPPARRLPGPERLFLPLRAAGGGAARYREDGAAAAASRHPDTRMRARARCELAGGRGHHRGAARAADPPLPGERERRSITKANLIVATGHNNLAMNHSRRAGGAPLHQRQRTSKEGMLNRVSAVSPRLRPVPELLDARPRPAGAATGALLAPRRASRHADQLRTAPASPVHVPQRRARCAWKRCGTTQFRWGSRHYRELQTQERRWAAGRQRGPKKWGGPMRDRPLVLPNSARN
jgi:NAD-reducing hydrogenase large subunit